MNHQKCAKISQNELNRDTECVCRECFAATFPFTNTSANELLENTYNSNFICKILNWGGKSKLNQLHHELLNLKDLNFSKHKKHAQNNPGESLTYSILISTVLMNFIN